MNFFEITLFDFYLWKLILLTIGGLLAGFINTIAGGGSLLTIPLLIFTGMETQTANGTNRIAIFLQNAVAVLRFSQKGTLKWNKKFFIFVGSIIIPSLAGSFLGAYIAIILTKKAFDIVVGILMLLVLSTLFIKPKAWEKRIEKIIIKWWRIPAFFLIGIYGGFIQAGVGFLILTTLIVFMGFNIISANALKALIILCYTIVALIIYIINGQTVLIAGLFLALGNVLGSLIGVKSVFKIKATFIRWLIVCAVIITVLKLFGLINFG